ncbi:hypothetical protein GCM10027053_15780 [Intrasporangium mesophilum]
MALAAELAKLSEQSKRFEDTVANLCDRNDANATERTEALRTSVDQARARVAARADEQHDQVEAGWARLHQSVSDGFDSLRTDAAERHAQHQVGRAARVADIAEFDAEDAVDFAIFALEQAEYYVLAASQARLDADATAAADQP